jgi:hypothetical protein
LEAAQVDMEPAAAVLFMPRANYGVFFSTQEKLRQQVTALAEKTASCQHGLLQRHSESLQKLEARIEALDRSRVGDTNQIEDPGTASSESLSGRARLRKLSKPSCAIIAGPGE